MNRLVDAFNDFRAAGRKALLPYITAGYPDLTATIEIARSIDPQRCACLELGIPFSDPIADGPVIQTSFARALERGFKIDRLFETLARHRSDIAVPLVAMVSYSIIYRRGSAGFVAAARTAGVDGLIVPDLSIEEAFDLARSCRAGECPLVMIIAPTSDADRRRRIAELSSPFIYYQSVAGVTGERAALPADLVAAVEALRMESGKPVCVGFGISRPEQVAAVCRVADGAIVGSAIVRRMNDAVDRGGSSGHIAVEICRFIDELSAPLVG
jgi:tryptophan synthase alpha chain